MVFTKKTLLAERREKPRENFETKVIIIVDNKVFAETVSKDVSLKGVYLKATGLKKGMECSTIITLTDSTPELRVELQGKVVRVDDFGVGIIFSQPMDLDNFIYLQNIVAYNNRIYEMSLQ